MNAPDTNYAARFTETPAFVIPQASDFWQRHKIEAHVFAKTPLWQYLTAPHAVNDKMRCQMMTRLDNGDLLVIFRKKHLERAIAAIYGIKITD